MAIGMTRILKIHSIGIKPVKYDANELSLQQAAGYHVGSLHSPMKLNTSKFEFIPRCKQRGIRT